MNTLIALAVRLSGAGWVWGKVDGYKTKIAAIGLMLSGAALMLAGASEILSALAACKDLACGIGLFRGLADNPHAATCLKGFLAFQGGLGALGLGHKLDKTTTQDAPGAPQKPPTVSEPPKP